MTRASTPDDKRKLAEALAHYHEWKSHEKLAEIEGKLKELEVEG